MQYSLGFPVNLFVDTESVPTEHMVDNGHKGDTFLKRCFQNFAPNICLTKVPKAFKIFGMFLTRLTQHEVGQKVQRIMYTYKLINTLSVCLSVGWMVCLQNSIVEGFLFFGNSVGKIVMMQAANQRL